MRMRHRVAAVCPKEDSMIARMQSCRPPDAELIQLTRCGSAEAFEELVSRHRSTCLRVAAAILRNSDDAEEAVQDALLKAYNHLGSFEQKSQFSTWVTRIVVNCCLMRLRHDRRMPLSGLGHLDLSLATHYTPEARLGTMQVSEVLLREVNRLPKLFRQVILLRDVENRSLEEVAVMLGLNVQTVKSRLFRARREMRNRMVRHCGIRGAATLAA